MISPELGEGLTLGDHGSTFAGGPICARAAIEALEILSDPELLAASRERGEEIRAGLSDHPAVSDIRGRGLMLGIALSDGVDSREVAAAALASGLVVNAPNPETIRLLPPLVVTADEVQTGVATLRAALDGRG